MFSVVNNACGLKVCRETDCIRDKAAYLSDTWPWVDMAIGIILVVIGALAMHGKIPMAGGEWMVGAGSVQLGLGVIIKCYSPCKTLCCVGISRIRGDQVEGYEGVSAQIHGMGEFFQ